MMDQQTIRSYAGLTRLFSNESLADKGKAAENNCFLFKKLSTNERDKMLQLISKNCSVESIPSVFVTQSLAEKEMYNAQNNKLHALTDKIVSASGTNLRNYLPESTRKIVNAMEARKNYLLSAASTKQNASERECYAFEAQQCELAAKQIVFGTLANTIEVERRNMRNNPLGSGFSMESIQSYASATVFYPVFENSVVWYNAAATVYPKLIPIKSIANDITQTVIHTMTYVLEKLDKDNRVEAEVERSQLYRSFNDPQYAKFRKMMERDVIIDKTEFKKLLLLDTTPLSKNGSKPALEPMEFIKSDFEIIDHKVSDGWKGPIKIETPYTITDGQAVNESYYNGQSFYYTPDKAHPEKFYIISINYDSIKKSLLVSAEPCADSSLPAIEEIKFRFKIHDANFITRNDTRWKIYERPTFLPTPTMNRKEINHNVNEFNLITLRNDADQLSRYMSLVVEEIGHHKETIFKEGIDATSKKLATELEAAKNTKTEDQVLYIDYELDLSSLDDLNRQEGLGMRLGGTIQALIKNYNNRAKSQANTSLSILCHTTSSSIIAQATKAVSGVVTDDNNGGFLGVDVDPRTSVLTVGTDAAAPVSAIIVETDKIDVKADCRESNGDRKPNGDVVYPFILFPRFKEANLATNIMIEVPTRVISDPNIRSEVNPNIGATFSEWGAMYYDVRNAGGILKVKGSLIPGIL